MPRRLPTENGRQHAGASARRTVGPPLTHLLQIPLELRQSIYSYFIDDESFEPLLHLLLVNRQINKEAKPFLFRRPLVFEGQSELFEWLRMVRREDLHLVSDLAFQLQDIKPDEIVGALGKRLRQVQRTRPEASSSPSSRDNPYHEACELEVRRIGEAFSLMPNVRKLIVIPCTEADPRPSHRMLIQFSKMLSRCFPNLDTLLSRETSLPISFVANKPRLKHLQIPSCCCSSSAEISSVCNDIPASKLAIYGGIRSRSSEAPQREIVAEILKAIRPLRELTLYESNVEVLSIDVAHEALVKAPDAIGKHLRTLRTLKVLVNYTPKIPRATPTLGQLRKFLQHSAIERLEMAEPLIFTLSGNLPSSLRTYVIRLDRPCMSDLDLEDRIERLMEHFETFAEYLNDEDENQLSNLKEILIVIESDEDEDEIEEIEQLVQAQRLFFETGVELRWVLAETHASL